MRKIAKTLGMLFVVGIVGIGISGCAQPKPQAVLGSDFSLGSGTHILRLPTLGQELEAEFANREKKWVRRIFIHTAPMKNQLLWVSNATQAHRVGLLSNDYTDHKASYYLSEGMTGNLKRALGLYYNISPNSDIEVDVRLKVEQSGKHEGLRFVTKFMDVTTKFSLRLTESLGSQTVSDKIFTGHERSFHSLSLRDSLFPRKHDAESMLEDAYRKLWKDLLKG